MLSALPLAGEMGGRIELFDWSATSLCAIGTWTAPLRNSVSTITAAPFPMAIFWGKDYITVYNDAFVKILGAGGKHPAILGMPHEEAFAETQEFVKPLFDAVYNEAKSFRYEDQLVPIYRNGKLDDVYWTFSYSPIFDDAGKIGGILVVCSETTQKVMNIMEKEEQFRTLSRYSPTIVTRHDTAKKYLYASPAIEKITGIPAEQFIGKGYRELGLPTELCDFFDKQLDAVYLSKKMDCVEYYTPDKSAYLSTHIIPELDTDGTIRSTISISSDITARKNAEDELRYQKSLLESVTANTDLALFLMDEKQYCIYMNEAAEKMTGFRLEELKGKQLHYYVHHTHPNGRHYPLEECPIDQALPTEKRMKGEEVFVHKDGRFYPVAFTASPIYIDGKPIGTVIEARETTEEKKKENELLQAVTQQKKAFALLESLLQNAPVGFAFFDKEHRYVRINETLADINGISGDEHIGKTIEELLPSNAKLIVPILEQVMATKEAVTNVEVAGYTPKEPDVERFWLVGYYPVFDATGNDVDYVGVTVVEITDRKKAELALKQSEEQFRNFSNNIQNLAWIADGDGWIYWYNDRWYNYTGTTLEEMQGWGWEKVHHPDHIDRVVTFVKNAWSKGEEWELTFPLRSKTGEYRWFLTRCLPIIGKDGKPTKWIGTNTDINEQVALQKALEQSERQLKMVADFLPQIVWATTAEGYHNFYNQRWYEFTGHTKEQSPGEGWSTVLHPDDVERTQAVWDHSLQTGDHYQIEYRMKRADGEYRWLLARAIPFKNETGEITRWFGTSTDIHSQRLAAELLEAKVKERTKELQDANDTLLHLNEELTQFNYITSHDLQEPLRKIQVFTQRVEHSDYDNLSEGAKRDFQKIRNSAERMRRSLHDLLEYSTLGREAEFVDVDLNKTLGDVLQDLEMLIKEKGAIIHSGTLPTLKAIPVQMQQLFSNVINNALKYAKEGVPPEIHITAAPFDGTTSSAALTPSIKKDKPYVDIVVTDNGIGFNSKHAEKLFMLFQRLHNRNQYSGTGIGLAICRKVVLRHGGHMYAEGKEGEGAHFHILLPLE